MFANTLHKIAMLVDDNEIDIFIVKKMFEQNQFSGRVIIRNSGAEALDYLIGEYEGNRNLPNVIFLDLFMPKMDGYEFLIEYSKLPEMLKKQCKIVILSVLVNPSEIKKLKSNKDVFEILEKPLTKIALNQFSLFEKTFKVQC